MRSALLILICASAHATGIDCKGAPDGVPCATGDRCTDNDVCVGGVCKPGPARDCRVGDDGCYASACDPVLSCVVIDMCHPPPGAKNRVQNNVTESSSPAAINDVTAQAPGVPDDAPPPATDTTPAPTDTTTNSGATPTSSTPASTLDAPSAHVRGDSIMRGCDAVPGASGGNRGGNPGFALGVALTIVFLSRKYRV